MKGFVDIHSHILPGVDDGADSIEEAVELVKMAYKEGTRYMVATPHYRRGRFGRPVSELEKKLQELKLILKQKGIQVKVVLGNEVYYFSGIVEKLDSKRIQTLGDTNYVLVEFPPMEEYRTINNGLNHIIQGGYRPILAHAERCVCLTDNLEYVRELVEMGIYIQVNASSLTNILGIKKKTFIKKLLKENLVHLIATDTHDIKVRTSGLKKCAEYLKKKYGKEYVQTLMIENPKKILENQYI